MNQQAAPLAFLLLISMQTNFKFGPFYANYLVFGKQKGRCMQICKKHAIVHSISDQILCIYAFIRPP